MTDDETLHTRVRETLRALGDEALPARSFDELTAGPAPTTPEPPTEPDRPRRLPALVGAAMAVVVVVTGVSIWTLRDTSSDPEPSPATNPPASPEDDSANALPSESGWQQLPDPPLSPRTEATAVATDDEIVVVGGWEFLCPPGADCVAPDEAPFADGAAFDLETGTWRSIQAAPMGFTSAETAVLGGEIYMLTWDRESDEPQMLRYRPDEDSWDVVEGSPPGQRRIVATDERLVAYSESDERGRRAVWQFDPVTEAWSMLPDHPLPDSFDRRMVWDGTDLVSLGIPLSVVDDGEDNRTVGARFDVGSETWEDLPVLDGSGFHAVALDGEIIVGPGFDLDGGGRFDPDSGTWSPLAAPPDDEAAGSMVGVLGSSLAGVEREGSGWVLDVMNDSWIDVPAFDERGMDLTPALTAVGRSLFVFGGQRWPESEPDLVEDATADGQGELLGDAWIWNPPAE